MAAAPGDERERLLDPVDRISEILFGLIMAVTIVGSLAVATAGKAEMRTVTMAALGCNLAWGLVDAVMYVVRTATSRARLHTLGMRIRASDPATGDRLVRQVLPEELVPLLQAEDVSHIRERVRTRPVRHGPLLHGRDFAEAAGIFSMVVLATFPVVLPYLLLDSPVTALRVSQAVTVAMLLLCGVALGRYAGHPRPWLTGACMALFGGILIGVVKALGG
ncbi:MAG: hypothetical protein U1F10_11315 [Burkholderiales bacterium]